MPLRARRPDGTNMLSVDCSREQWAEVRAALASDRSGWQLPCCGAGVVAKTSQLGTQFFAHAARADCAYIEETAHHLHLKSLAVFAARSHGWQATTEVAGGTDGDPWVADVLATLGNAQVAVEVQWSSQTPVELLARQAKYKRHGVRGLWLIRSTGFPITEAVPAACVREDERGYLALLPSHDGFRRVSEPAHWSLQLPVDQFLDAAFGRRLQWGLRHGEPIRYQLLGGPQGCYKCGATTVVIHEVRLELEEEPTSLNLSDLTDAPQALDILITADERAALGIGEIRIRHSRTASDSYLSAGCVRCGALQGEHYLSESLQTQSVLRRGVTHIDATWRAVLRDFSLSRRWRVLSPGHSA